MDPERNREIVDADKGCVWHPFTQMRDWQDTEPIIIEKARGIELVDTEGRTYLDGVSSLWTNVHGHGVPEIDEAVKAQIDKVAHTTLLGLGSVPSAELARELVELAPPGLEKVFYSDSGSTAVEVALKMAFQYRQQNGAPERIRFACLDSAYHGDTLGSVSVGGIDLFHSLYRPLLFKAVRLPSPYCYRCPLELERSSCAMACADRAGSLIAKHGRELAAVVMEPLVQGAAGMIVHPEGFLQRVAAACREHDVFLILDEVATGFGRTGKLFACEHEDVVPDLLALAKGLSGGYLPLAATLASPRIFEGFLGSVESMRTFFHGHTYTGNPLACAAALASLDLFRTRDVLGCVSERAVELAALLEDMNGLPYVGDVRQRGLMAGIELVKDKAGKTPFPAELRLGHRVILEARKRGAILRPLGDVLVLMPPLAITSDALQRLMGIVKESLTAATEAL